MIKCRIIIHLYVWRWRNCPVFHSNRAVQETTADTLTGGTKNCCPLPHALIAWSLLIHWIARFLSPLPLQLGDSTTPTGALLRGGRRIHSSLHGLHSIGAPGVLACGSTVCILWCCPCQDCLTKKKVSQSMSFTRSTSSLQYLYLCLSHSGKV